MTFSVTTFSIKILNAERRYAEYLYILRVVMLSVVNARCCIFYCYAECHNAHYYAA